MAKKRGLRSTMKRATTTSYSRPRKIVATSRAVPKEANLPTLAVSSEAARLSARAAIDFGSVFDAVTPRLPREFVVREEFRSH
jgi:hypothetical protein